MWKEFYLDYKWRIRITLALCFLFSAFAFGSAFFVRANAETLEAVTVLGGSFGSAFVPVIQSCLGGLDVSSALTLMCVLSGLLDVLPEDVLIGTSLEGITDYSFGLLDITGVQIFIILWFIVSKLSRSIHVTYTAGVFLENVESKMGGIVHLVIVASQLMTNFEPTLSAQAAFHMEKVADAMGVTLSVIGCFLLLVMALFIYLFVRALFFFLDIVMIPISSLIPFVGTVVEFGKTVSVILLGITAIFFPYVFIAIFTGILLLAIFLFRRIYAVIRYYNHIYLSRPSKHRMIVDNDTMMAVKVPKKIKDFVANKEVKVLLPVYLLKKVQGNKDTRRYERWWLIVTKDSRQFCKEHFGHRDYYVMDLPFVGGQKLYLKNSRRFVELFTIKGSENELGQPFHKVSKELHFVCGRECRPYFDKLKESICGVDYEECRSQQKRRKLCFANTVEKK